MNTIIIARNLPKQNNNHRKEHIKFHKVKYGDFSHHLRRICVFKKKAKWELRTTKVLLPYQNNGSSLSEIENTTNQPTYQIHTHTKTVLVVTHSIFKSDALCILPCRWVEETFGKTRTEMQVMKLRILRECFWKN